MNMKKSLVSALTTALVVGAASTTFAAANPFEDVPADHWAYDAIAQLAADGVIEGYGDGTYRGDQEITRYEMAQMIARAMAKGGGDKALIDKLAAEFADELNNLGVRVAALEKKVDNVKWYGLFRYTYSRTHEDNKADGDNTNNFRLRLQMAATINKNWTGYGRMEYATEGGNMDTAANSNRVVVNRVYAEGKYGKTTIDLGRFPYYTDVDNGMVFDDEFSGGMVQFGDKANVKLMAGRYHDNYADTPLSYKDWTDPDNPVGFTTASYAGIELNSDPTKKFTIGAAYHHFTTGDLKANTLNGAIAKEYNDDALNIWEIGMGYRFDKNTKLSGAFARNSSGDSETKYRQAWSVQFDYKGADRKKPGSWGAFAAYRHLGNYASVFPTYNSMWVGQKGWNIGVKYAVLENILAIVEYYNGKNIMNDNHQDTFFIRSEIYF